MTCDPQFDVSPMPRFWVDFNDIFNDIYDIDWLGVSRFDVLQVWWPSIYEGARVELVDGGGYHCQATVRNLDDDDSFEAVLDWSTWRTSGRYDAKSNFTLRGDWYF